MTKFLFVCECGQALEIDKDKFIRLQPNQKFVCKDCIPEDSTVIVDFGKDIGKIIELNDF